MAVPKCRSFQNVTKNYETSTEKAHHFIPELPQDFDCRVKANLKKDTLDKNITIRDEEFETVYRKEYFRKSSIPDKCFRVPPAQCIDYSRNVQEKMFVNPPPPIGFQLSEMKDSYRINYLKASDGKETAPVEMARCLIIKEGCEQQPSIPPQRKGYWKWTDPYLTTYKAQFIPMGDEVDEKIKSKIITFYNANDVNLPPSSGNKIMFDKRVFNKVLPNRLLGKPQDRVPNFGMQSEYQGHYTKHSFSELSPYLQESGVEFEDPLAPASRYQDMMAPGMYCTEYCHYGRGSVRQVVAPNFPKKQITHEKNCCRIYG